MPVEPVLILIVAAVAANLVLMAFIVVPPLLGRPSRVAREAEAAEMADRQAAEAAVVGGMMGAPDDDGISAHAYDRIVRIVAWFFLLSTTAIVAATGLWPANQPAILILLALGGVFVVVVHDLLPTDLLGPAKFVVEGSVAITLSTLLVALTGGVVSPFFFALPADRGRRRAGRLAADHPRPGRRRGPRLRRWPSSPGPRPTRRSPPPPRPSGST